jgi:hypothetical protein
MYTLQIQTDKPINSIPHYSSLLRRISGKATPKHHLPTNSKGEKEEAKKAKTKVVSSQRVIFYGILCGFVKCGSGTHNVHYPAYWCQLHCSSNLNPISHQLSLASCIASLTCATQRSPGRWRPGCRTPRRSGSHRRSQPRRR